MPGVLGRTRPPLALLGLGLIVGAAVILPAAYLVIVFAGDFGHACETATSSRTLHILVNTLGLAAAVTATSIAIALPVGWLTVRTDLPGRGASGRRSARCRW